MGKSKLPKSKCMFRVVLNELGICRVHVQVYYSQNLRKIHKNLNKIFEKIFFFFEKVSQKWQLF